MKCTEGWPFQAMSSANTCRANMDSTIQCAIHRSGRLYKQKYNQ